MKTFFISCLFGTLSLFGFSNSLSIHEHGYWVGTGADAEHQFDPALAKSIALFFQNEQARSVVDLGCGMGLYGIVVMNFGIDCEGYDGNPDTPALTGGYGQVADLSQVIDLGKTYDWVLSLEVGEHLPKEFEENFIKNLHQHNTKGIVLSWAVKGQGGYGHFNCQNNDYIKEIMADYGYENDLVAETMLRTEAMLSWFKNTIMVFRRGTETVSNTLERHLKRIEHTVPSHQIRNIDYVYLINLDHRTDRLANSLKQLGPFGIRPQRVSAVFAKNLSPNVFDDVGLKFIPGMASRRWVQHYTSDGKCIPEFLTEASFGKNCFWKYTLRGAIGCTLSHLSVLQDAYDMGYETIWVLEDDFLVKDDPHAIAKLIDRLDALVGEEGWDVLYTDCEIGDNPKDSDLENEQTWAWRPDMGTLDPQIFTKRKKISEDFTRVGCRWQTTSMVIRRSGMKKILDYEKSHGIFFPYDLELAWAPDIRLFMLRYPMVTQDRTSDSDIIEPEIQDKTSDANSVVSDKTPPRTIPEHLWKEFTLNDSIPVRYMYFDETRSEPKIYSSNDYDMYLQKARRRELGYYPDTDRELYRVLDAMAQDIRGKEIGIIGSGLPWYEGIVLSYGAYPVVIEYHMIKTDDPRVKYYTPAQYEKHPIKFDLLLSISSTEHDGLGRYGDPIDPDGDIKSMQAFKKMLNPGGKLLLAVPIGADRIDWNAHRIYGNKRLPLLLQDWNIVKTFGLTPDRLNQTETWAYQPIFLLTPK